MRAAVVCQNGLGTWVHGFVERGIYTFCGAGRVDQTTFDDKFGLCVHEEKDDRK